MKKRNILLLIPCLLFSFSCSSNSLVSKTESKKEVMFDIAADLLKVNYMPNIYNSPLQLDFEYNKELYDLYYSFDSNHLDSLSHYFKYDGEGINVYEDRLKSKTDYPCTTSVDAILSYDFEGKCVSNNYINNIQKPDSYKFKSKLNTLNVILKDKKSDEIKLKKTLTYLIENNATSIYKIPIVSINIPYEDMFNPYNGFYNNIRDDISSRCSLEIIDPYYNEYTNLNSSIKLGGNWTLGYPLRTLNLNFNKDENGNKNTPVTNHLFKDRNAISSSKTLTNFTRLRVHSGGNAFEESIGFNDALLQGLMVGTKASTAACRPVLSYINGEYWGLTFLREHYKTNYVEQNYGIKKSKVVMFDLKGELLFDDGDEEEIANEKLNTLNDYIKNKDLSIDDNYNDFVNNVIDVESLIDVVLAQAYASNWDFIGNFNNLKAFASTTIDTKNPYQDGKIRFCLHDADFAFRDTNNVLDINHNNFYGKYPLLNSLMKNSNFRSKLLSRAKELISTNLSYENAMKVMNGFVNDIKDYKVVSQKRWGATNDYATLWNNELNYVKTNIRNKQNKFISEVTNFVNYY